ncbi:MAG: flagellar protein FliT [Methylococcales bacterium]|nr:flagellar protein FliT [Methylococcales bacterium]
MTEQGLLDQALELSEQMLKHALDDDWAEVARLHAERDLKLHQYFQPAPTEAAEHVRRAVQAVLNYDQQTVALGQRYKNSLQEQLNTISTGKSAIKAYQNY